MQNWALITRSLKNQMNLIICSLLWTLKNAILMNSIEKSSNKCEFISSYCTRRCVSCKHFQRRMSLVNSWDKQNSRAELQATSARNSTFLGWEMGVTCKRSETQKWRTRSWCLKIVLTTRADIRARRSGGDRKNGRTWFSNFKVTYLE